MKPENVMFRKKGGSVVKLIDFGLSCSVPPGCLLTKFCGSFRYAAPEVLRRQPCDGRAADVWSLGVMLYVMVVGMFPFVDRLAAEDVNYPPLVTAGDRNGGDRVETTSRVKTSAEFKDLIEQIFQKEPRRRITIHGIMAHPWTDFLGDMSRWSTQGTEL